MTVAHSDWMFGHQELVIPHTDWSELTNTTPSSDAPSDDHSSVASVLKSIWSWEQHSSGALPPAVTVSNSALTVSAGGTVALPIQLASQDSGTTVTISGLTAYESVTDNLDHQIFTGASVTLTAGEVASGVSLASDYAGTGQPVNTLTVTASDTLDHHVLTSAPQSIVVTDPPAATSASSSGTSNGLTLQVSGDMYNGDPQFLVFVDGQQVGGTYTVTADHSQGQTQTITIPGTFDPTEAHQVEVQFTNDAWDGTPWWSEGISADGHDVNLYVDAITLNGQTIEGSAGTNGATNGVVPADPNGAVMDINGTLTFAVPADAPASASASGSAATTASGSTSDPGTGTSDPASATSDPSTGSSEANTGTSDVGPVTSSVGTGAGATPSGPGYYVSPTGSDSNPGTLAAPFATLERAQQAMEDSSTKTTYVEGGTYNITSTLTLTAADDGETWQYYAPDGVDSAVLDGGGTTTDLIDIVGGSNITINGLTLQNFYADGIHTMGGPSFNAAVDSGNTFINNNIGDNVESGWNANAIFCEGASPDTTIENNYIHDIGSQGISLTTWFNAGDSIDGSKIDNNVVVRCVTRVTDGGGIYVGMHGGFQATNVQIENNYVSDMGGPGVTSVTDIYLDDNANHVTVEGNVCGPINPESSDSNFLTAFEIHNGADNTISGNIVDLGSAGNEYAAFWFIDGSSINGMAGNTFTDNIVVSGYTGSENAGSGSNVFFENASTGDYTIANNDYYNYAGGTVSTTGALNSDSDPVSQNPDLSGWTYALASGSPVFSSPVNFPAIVGGWGPPGFVIPETGPSPSA